MAPKLPNSLKRLLERAGVAAKFRKGEPAPPDDGQKSNVHKDALVERRPGEAPRVFLSGPLLLALSLVLVCAVAWAFFMGLMVGRGQDPQKSLPVMAGILESDDQAAARADDPAEGAPEESGLVPGAQGPSGMLPAPQAGVHAPPRGDAARAWPDASAPKPQASPARAVKKAPPDNRKYDFVYQAAAFRSNADASRVQRAINGKGLKATVKRSGKVYLLMVNFRGTQGEMDRMLARMRGQGLGKPLQLAKTPVEEKRQRKK